MWYLCEIENIDNYWLGFTSAPLRNYTIYHKKNERIVSKLRSYAILFSLIALVWVALDGLGYRNIKPGKLNRIQMTQPTVCLFLFVCTVVAGYCWQNWETMDTHFSITYSNFLQNEHRKYELNASCCTRIRLINIPRIKYLCPKFPPCLKLAASTTTSSERWFKSNAKCKGCATKVNKNCMENEN